MCHFITMVVGGGDSALIAKVMRDNGRNSRTINNASLAEILKPGERQMLTTSAECDCGTVLATTEAKAPRPIESEIPKLRAKGWSQSKIDRWFESKSTANARPDSRQPLDSFELWEKILERVIGLPGVSSAGLFVHFYSGDQDHEVFIPTRLNVNRAQFSQRMRECIQDRLLIITA